MSENMEKLEKLNLKMKVALDEIREMAKANGAELVRELAEPLFTLGVPKIRWTQYTPFFNDGDSCEFSVHDAHVFIEDEEDEVYSYDLERQFEEYQPWSGCSAEENERYRQSDNDRTDALIAMGITKDNASEISEALSQFSKFICGNEQLMQMAFGDHVEVTVTPDGVTVEEYNHD